MNTPTPAPNTPTPAPDDEYAGLAKWFDAEADRHNELGAKFKAAGVTVKGVSKPVKIEADGSILD